MTTCVALFFALIGVEVFHGALHYACYVDYINDTGTNYTTTLSLHLPLSLSLPSTPFPPLSLSLFPLSSSLLFPFSLSLYLFRTN